MCESDVLNKQLQLLEKTQTSFANVIAQTTNATKSNDDLQILFAKRDLEALLVSNTEPFTLQSDAVLQIHTDCSQVCELILKVGAVETTSTCAANTHTTNIDYKHQQTQTMHEFLKKNC